MVDSFQTELLPVAADLTARLVSLVFVLGFGFPGFAVLGSLSFFLFRFPLFRVCDVVDVDADDAISVRPICGWRTIPFHRRNPGARTLIWTMLYRMWTTTRRLRLWASQRRFPLYVFLIHRNGFELYALEIQVVASIESSRDILIQVQEIVVPIVHFTLENKILGVWFFMGCFFVADGGVETCLTTCMISSTALLSSFVPSRPAFGLRLR